MQTSFRVASSIAPRDSSSRPRPTAAQRWFAAAQLVAIIAVLVIIADKHPSERRFAPPCPSVWITGIHCPGCGSTRAVHFLLRGQFASAWRHNPAMILLGLPAGVWHLSGLFLLLFDRRPPVIVLAKWIPWTLLALIVLFGVVRNLPGATFERLRPPSTFASPLHDPAALDDGSSDAGIHLPP